MTVYKISIDPEALQDSQDATDWYNEQLEGLGGHFQKQVKTQISLLKKNAGTYSVRYQDVCCMLIKRFPFLVHFKISKKSLRYLPFCTQAEGPESGLREETNDLFVT